MTTDGRSPHPSTGNMGRIAARAAAPRGIAPAPGHCPAGGRHRHSSRSRSRRGVRCRTAIRLRRRRPRRRCRRAADRIAAGARGPAAAPAAAGTARPAHARYDRHVTGRPARAAEAIGASSAAFASRSATPHDGDHTAQTRQVFAHSAPHLAHTLHPACLSSFLRHSSTLAVQIFLADAAGILACDDLCTTSCRPVSQAAMATFTGLAQVAIAMAPSPNGIGRRAGHSLPHAPRRRRPVRQPPAGRRRARPGCAAVRAADRQFLRPTRRQPTVRHLSTLGNSPCHDRALRRKDPCTPWRNRRWPCIRRARPLTCGTRPRRRDKSPRSARPSSAHGSSSVRPASAVPCRR